MDQVGQLEKDFNALSHGIKNLLSDLKNAFEEKVKAPQEAQRFYERIMKMSSEDHMPFSEIVSFVGLQERIILKAMRELRLSFTSSSGRHVEGGIFGKRQDPDYYNIYPLALGSLEAAMLASSFNTPNSRSLARVGIMEILKIMQLT